MAETKLLFSYNIIINELSSVPLLHGVLFLHWTVGRTEGSFALALLRCVRVLTCSPKVSRRTLPSRTTRFVLA
jgi:hypothetical protein